jgi:hypothetical protein
MRTVETTARSDREEGRVGGGNSAAKRGASTRRRAFLVALGLLLVGVLLGTVIRLVVAAPERPRLLVQAGASRTRCIDLGSVPARSRITEVERDIGLDFNCLEAFATVDPAWTDWVSPWVTHAASGWPTWLQASPAARSVVLAIDLIPDSVSDNRDPLRWEAPCDRGAYDRYASTLAKNLVASGFEYAVIRLGPEANGRWEDDFVGTTEEEQRSWAGCFDREVSAMRAVPGTNFEFDWNVNACEEPIPFSQFYPGDAAVDIVGIDVFDATCTMPPRPASWALLRTEPDGVDAFRVFASEHDKPMSIPEWGLLDLPGSDNPSYVEALGSFVNENDVSFESYYDADDDSIMPMGPRVPKALDAYRDEFSRPG